MTTFVTGGAGFIGSALVRVLVARGERVTVLDAFTYAATRAHLQGVACEVVEADVCDRDAVAAALSRSAPDVVFHLAAESHVDRSIDDAAPVVLTNVLGTQTLLDAVRRSCPRARVVHVSTDEVLGPAPPEVLLDEGAPLSPTSPYAASKAGGELLALSYARTFGLDVVVARPTNQFGPRQLPEKLVPLVACRALLGLDLPVYGDGLQTRDWMHVDDACAGLLALAERGARGRVYHLSTESEKTTLDVVRAVCEALGAPFAELVRHVEDRPGHDKRYGVSSRRIREELGWAPKREFAESLRETVLWYRDNEAYRAATRAHLERKGLGK